MRILPIQAGPYSGEMYGALPATAAPGESLASVVEILAANGARSRSAQAVSRHEIRLDDRALAVAIKSYRRVWWRDRHFAHHGSKAARAFRAAVRLAEHGVGTPRPIAFLDRWEGARLIECHYLCEYEESATSFRDEINRLFREDPLARRILSLMETVATAIARMHDAGVCHLDLGNQNILVRRVDDDHWDDVRFIDLDRSWLRESLTLRERARDVSRIDLPSAMLPVFKCMYFGHRRAPREFEKWEAHYRQRFAFHTASRKYRHPLRTLRGRGGGARTSLERTELWVWDDRSEQAIGALRKGDRYARYPWRNAFHVAKGLFRGTVPVLARYRELMDQAFRREVSLANRIGVAIGAEDEREGPLVHALGPAPVLVRLYRHAPPEDNAAAVEVVRRLKAAGHSTFVALVQDRACIRQPALWLDFAQAWLPRLAGIADAVEIGHAVNRVKWGIQDFNEYRELVETALRVARASGSFKVTGPAAIDFEYHYLAGLLDLLPDGSFDALSHHLYVDRRGAPENRQGRFSAVEKFALAKAFAGWSPSIRGDELIVSEVNWPLLGTGVHSPISAPYVFPDAKSHGSAVDEETHADFMLRYYALALCSGFVDQVYWWRLVARGVGLVDNTTEPWRPRPGYAALRHFAQLLGDATFVEKLPAAEGIWVLRFRKPDGSGVVMAWSAGNAGSGAVRFDPGFGYDVALNRDGREVEGKPVMLAGSPVYFYGVR